jgi:DNA-binding MarR family transcriptional regulator
MKNKDWLTTSQTHDRRAHQLELTSEGERILVQAFSSWQEAQGKVTDILGEENAAAIRKVAGSLGAGCNDKSK